MFDIVLGMARGPATAAEVLELLAHARDVCGRLEPDTIGLHEIEAVFDSLVACQRLTAGAVTRTAARYDEAGAWKRNGAKSAADDIARKTGTGTSRARRKLSTSKRLGHQTGTDQALRHGDVSDDQADDVSDAVAASPDSEEELLDSARREPLHQLRKRAAAARARADKDREATRRRLHEQRCMRRWNDADGMGNLLLRLPVDEMAEIDAALKTPIDKAFADARNAGRFEPAEAYAADVARDRLLANTPNSDAAPTRRSQAVRPDKKVIASIDLAALNRGSVHDGERCEIAGVGPVSLTALRALMSDAVLALVIRDGVDIINVTHLGRQVTAHQRTALEARGGACEFCGSTFRVEIDHIAGWALTHTTTIDDLSLKCWHCHDRKTRLGLRETGPPGNRHFLHPDGTPWRAPPDDRPDRDHPDCEEPAETTVQADLFTLAN